MHHVLNGRTDLAEAAGAEHAVHFRQALENVVFVPLRQAAGHENLFQSAGLFHLGELQDLVDGLALGAVDKAAGVDDGDVAPVHLADHLVAGLIEQIEHLLAVDLIFRTAERDETNSIWHRSILLKVILIARDGRADLVAPEAAAIQIVRRAAQLVAVGCVAAQAAAQQGVDLFVLLRQLLHGVVP